MAKGDTKTNQYLDIAANGTRADLPSDTCCETRTQTLIRGVAERIIDVEDEVERLENNPDVADIVDTYADLMAYDTSKLTDKDIIRVLNDETHNNESTYYRYNKSSDSWTYIGSTGPHSSVQSDWDENDSTELDYIKNRPFYEETVESEIPQGTSNNVGNTPDAGYVWHVEQLADYALHTVLSDFSDGDTVHVDITYSAGGVEKTDSGVFTLSITGGVADLESDMPAASRWNGAYITEFDPDTTVRWPVSVADDAQTVYITKIEYAKVKQIDAKYIPIDNDTITVNADGELQSSGGGGGTSNFNQLTNRPSYDNTTMTGSTSIPKVPTKTSELSNDSNFVTSGSLATVATTGAYSDLTGTPTIPAAQVNSDWNASSGVAEILNKPTIPTVNDATLTITQNGVSKGTFTSNDADDTTIALDDTTYSNFTGTDGTAAGAAGLVPAPATTDAGKFLKADGTWDTAGGGGPTVVQTTGTSATDVMSQNAVTVALGTKQDATTISNNTLYL